MGAKNPYNLVSRCYGEATELGASTRRFLSKNSSSTSTSFVSCLTAASCSDNCRSNATRRCSSLRAAMAVSLRESPDDGAEERGFRLGVPYFAWKSASFSRSKSCAQTIRSLGLTYFEKRFATSQAAGPSQPLQRLRGCCWGPGARRVDRGAGDVSPSLTGPRGSS